MATVNIGYGTEVTITLTLTSLAASATWVAGRQSTAVDNTTVKAMDYLVGGKSKIGATGATAGDTVEVWVYGEHEDTPTYPTPFTGTDGDLTVTRNGLYSSAVLAHVTVCDADANWVFAVKPFSIAALFCGNVPRHWGLFVVHNAATLSSTAGDHVFSAMPILPTVA